MWYLISDIKLKCWRIWICATLLIVCLNLSQTISGLVMPILKTNWMWVIANILPGLALLFVSTILDRRTSKIIPEHVYRMLFWGTFFYALLLIGTQLLEPLAINKALSIIDYKLNALWWLLPTQFLLGIGYYLTFFRKSLYKSPTKDAIIKVAGQQAKKWKHVKNEFKKKCQSLIAQAKIEEALKNTKNYIQERDIGNLNELISIEHQFNELKKDRTRNTISWETGNVAQNKIVLALIEFINQL